MRKIGLVGGMRWLSTRDYYVLFHELVSQRLGGFSTARLPINGLNFAEIMADV